MFSGSNDKVKRLFGRWMGVREEKEKIFHLGDEKNKLEKRGDGGEAWSSEGHVAFAQVVGSCTFLDNHTSRF